jgi:hypothetical protein
MHSLIEMDVDEVVELIGVASTKEEVCKSNSLLGAGIRAA